MIKRKLAPESMVEATNVIDFADHRRLTWKQERFAHAYIATGNATEAYRRSYDCERMAQKSIETEALRLLKHPGITLALDRYRRGKIVETGLSFQQHLDKLRELRDAAKASGQSRRSFCVARLWVSIPTRSSTSARANSPG